MATSKKTAGKKPAASKPKQTAVKSSSPAGTEGKYVVYAAGYTRDHKHGIWIYDYDPVKGRIS